MKSVLISIQPKWCDLIASGKKTIEVRKTKPKLETPFRVYIYETQGRTETPFVDEEGHHIFKGRGQVIGEFVCDEILKLAQNENGGYYIPKKQFGYACMTMAEARKYGQGKPLYAWHISDLVIYDKPKELSEFSKYGFGRPVWLKRPPQSWCYVESEGNDTLNNTKNN